MPAWQRQWNDVCQRLGVQPRQFAILLAGCPLEKARQIADDVVRAVNDHRFVWKDKIFGIGVSLVNNGCCDGNNYEIIYMSISSSGKAPVLRVMVIEPDCFQLPTNTPWLLHVS